MKVQILRSAIDDIAAGRKFYDRQEAGVALPLFLDIKKSSIFI